MHSARHKTRVHHQVTLSWHRAKQFRLHPLKAERLARTQPYSFNVNAFGLAQQGPDSSTSRLRGERFIHSATQPVVVINTSTSSGSGSAGGGAGIECV